MPKTAPFEEYADRYEQWFEEHEHAYQSELAALRRLLPADGDGVEIGVGSGRFAGPLGIGVGIDPSRRMLRRARERGIRVVRGVAESLPFGDGTFDTALVVTAICFVDDIPRTLAEAHRILGPGGTLVVGFIDKDSPVGRRYQAEKESNPFYRDAVFVSTAELRDAMESAGFTDFEFTQTVYRWPGEMEAPDPVESGYGDGSFVGIKATR
jgi:SAM-dependent methyltransferase